VLEQRLQRAAVQELHHEVVPVVLGDVQVEDLEDVVVADDVDGPRLVEEAIDDLVVVGELGMEELDRHPGANPRVHAHVDGSHPALAEQLFHPVAADVAPEQVVDGGDVGEPAAVLRTVENLVVVSVVAVGASPRHGTAS
jgi:hypothetical protein